MQNNAMSKWLSPLMAFCLSFIIIATLAPITGIQFDRQLDFWLLWLATMLILALPIGYLEIALVKRSKITALQALSSLTREADSSQRWRIAGWLAVIFMPFLAGGMLSNGSLLLNQWSLPNLPSIVVLGVLLVVALALSLLPRLILVGLSAIAVLASIVLANMMGTQLPAWQVTPIEFSEWGSATVLALVASGLGLGIYAQSSLSTIQKETVATKTALPIWVAQLLAVVAFAYFAVKAQAAAWSLVVAALMGAAVLFQLAREQLQQRQIAPAIQWLILVVTSAVWLIPQVDGLFNGLLMLWGLIICFIYTIFAGWIMKISHLRKAMNFSNEAFYNIWRIMVRVVSPLAIILAMVAVIGQLLP